VQESGTDAAALPFASHQTVIYARAKIFFKVKQGIEAIFVVLLQGCNNFNDSLIKV